jgi:cytochrome c biogenesis protein CcmG/thiol:disulfide interchange protein DsbE
MLPLSRVQVAIASAGLLALALAVALAAAMRGGVGQPPLGAVDAGFTTAATFELPRLNNDGAGAAGTFSLGDYGDRPVFVYFWASWCTPCKAEAPLIQRLWPEFEARGYTFVGVNIQDQEQDARRFVEEHGLTFPQVRDREGAVYLDYGVYGLPESFFLKPGLLVHEKYLGEFDETVLRERLGAIDVGAVANPPARTEARP